MSSHAHKNNTLLMGWLLTALLAAGAANPAGAQTGHLIPTDKGLTAKDFAALRQGRERLTWTGDDIKTIGMPIGGMAAGQLYLCGDGTLGSWQIANRYVFTGWGADCYVTEEPEKPVDSGFAVAVERDGKLDVRALNQQGFPKVEFAGEYPIGLMRYAQDDFPVAITTEAFSPFIPLNAHDSALPATLFTITVTNTSDKPVRASVLGFLENAICRDEVDNIGADGWREQTTCRNPDEPFVANRRTQIITTNQRTRIQHSIEPVTPHASRPAIVFEDFEASDFGKWTVEGEAFGPGPAHGARKWQRRLNGWVGNGLANSYHNAYKPDGSIDRAATKRGSATGSLTSPPFVIERDYITFYIGKGDQVGKTCINLLIDGKVVRSRTGSPNGKFDLLKNSLLWNFWDVREFAGKTARIQILDAATRGEKDNQHADICVDHIVFCDIADLRGAGTMTLTLNDTPGDAQAILSAGDLPKNIHTDADAAYPTTERHAAAIAAPMVTLQPGAMHTFTFALAWHFPNHRWGRNYANRFKDAGAVSDYLLDNESRLAGNTRLWHKTFYEDSTLPRWLLFRLHSTVGNLASGTTLWWGNGRVWGWEGVGSCEGTCTHVYNYAQAMAYLFPEAERIVREQQDFGEGFDEKTGLVGFRSNRAYAADGQCGTVLKAYREHLMSVDDAFLRRNWPKIRLAMQYMIGRDGNDDGLIEDSQHNTYDVNFVGPNTFVGSLYLAALRAAEKMGTHMGDADFAARCRRIYESGSRLTMDRLWNGEYFIQRVDLAKNPKSQYGDGCLADQLFGQTWAGQLALGRLYPKQAIDKAYESVWKYNWAPQVGPHNKAHRPERTFARGDDAGLFICTWPKSDYLDKGVRYREEVWTGIEYQMAAGMLWEDQTDRALAICRAIQDRYDPARHNPFNEVECGDHYARALASWATYLAVLGFEYDGPAGHIGFAPAITPDDFRAAFTAAEGWGLFAQKRGNDGQRNSIEVRWGKLRLSSLALVAAPSTKPRQATMDVDGKSIPATMQSEGERTTVTFAPVTLNAGQTLRITLR